MKNYELLTDEQLKIVHCESKFIVINAGAGSGKTSTLKSYTQQHLHKKFIYLCFNRLLCQEAMVKFNIYNVDCYTMHSLAYSKIGYKYAENNNLNIKSLKVIDILKPLEIIDFNDGKIVLDIFNNFINSNANEISMQHYPSVYNFVYKNNKTHCEIIAKKQLLLNKAKLLWQKMTDIQDNSIAMIANGFLKLFLLSNIDLSKNYDCILFDEAQDCDPLMLEFLLTQTQKCQIIMVGDRFQSIYAFRGAINSINLINKLYLQPITYLNLTKSFRFGSVIANIANLLIQDFLTQNLNLKGNDKIKSSLTLDYNKPFTIICRTNAGCFDIAYQIMQYNIPFKFLNEIDPIQLTRLKDIYYLLNNELFNIQDPLIKNFTNINDLKIYIKATGDIELQTMLNINLTFYSKQLQGQQSIIFFLNKIMALNNNVQNPHILITTVHKCKGLQFLQVFLHNDFPLLFDKDKKQLLKFNSIQQQQEIHLYYVAITRAIENLKLNDTLNNWLNNRYKNIEIFINTQINKEFNFGKWQYLMQYHPYDINFYKLNNSPVELKGSCFDCVNNDDLILTAIYESLNLLNNLHNNSIKITIFNDNKKIIANFNIWKKYYLQCPQLNNFENKTIQQYRVYPITFQHNSIWKKIIKLIQKLQLKNIIIEFKYRKINRTEKDYEIQYNCI